MRRVDPRILWHGVVEVLSTRQLTVASRVTPETYSVASLIRREGVRLATLGQDPQREWSLGSRVGSYRALGVSAALYTRLHQS